MAVWAERAEKLSVALLVRETARQVPPDDEQDAAERRRRYVRVAHEPDGGYRLWARLDAAGGAVVDKALMLGAERVPPDPSTGQPPAYETRCADALVGLARQSLSDERDPDRATIVVHVDGELASSGQVSGEIAGGPVISSATAQRLGCDARWQYVARGPHGPVGIGRTSRIIPAGLARQVLHLYGGMCAYPGCETRIFIEIHHILHWLLGGRTDLTNLAPFCWCHHAVLHQPGWQLARDPDGTLHFRRPDGRHLVTRPPRLNPDIRERMLGGGTDGEGNRGDPRQLE